MNENGVISFKDPWKYSHPELFPTEKFDIRSRGSACAPFWSDVDIRKSGSVRYATASGTSQNHRETSELLNVSRFINSRLTNEENNSTFEGTWMLIAHWDNVHPSPHGADDHLGISDEELEKVNIALCLFTHEHSARVYSKSYSTYWLVCVSVCLRTCVSMMCV